jgi:hypothetical protein
MSSEGGDHIEPTDNTQVPESQPEPDRDTVSKLDYIKDKLDTTIQWICDKYSEHPRSRGMTPFQHFYTALKFSGMCMAAGLMMMIHAFAPWWFQVSGGDLMITTATMLQEDRDEWDANRNEVVEQHGSDSDDDCVVVTGDVRPELVEIGNIAKKYNYDEVGVAGAEEARTEMFQFDDEQRLDNEGNRLNNSSDDDQSVGKD